jgi:drug/metabolite transporter (DMT)-like permease
MTLWVPYTDRQLPLEKNKTTRLALLALFGGAMAIAFAPIGVRLSQVGPSATAFWRLTLALPALWLWLILEQHNTYRPQRSLTSNDHARLGLAGLLFAGDLAVWHWSIHFTSVANATLLANFAPLSVVLGSWFILGQRVSRTFLLAMGVALIGIVLIVGTSLHVSLQHLWGDTLGLITAMFYASYILTVKRLRDEFSVATVMTWSGIACSATLLPIALLSDERILPVSALGWLSLLGLALISQVGGQSLIAYALAHLPAAFSSVGLLLQPVTATGLAWLVFGETLRPWQAVGGVLVLVGIVGAREQR